MAYSGQLLIFDIEGTDSNDRKDQSLKYELTTSMFALAVTHILMVNIWMKDIGRKNASNYGILKVIFEENLKIKRT